MNAAYRITSGFRRLGAAIGARLVRDDDVARVEHHGGDVSALNQRVVTFADEVESTVAKWETPAS